MVQERDQLQREAEQSAAAVAALIHSVDQAAAQLAVERKRREEAKTRIANLQTQNEDLMVINSDL